MIAGKDVVEILCAIIPMYFPLAIAYITVRWLKLFTAEQSAGINRFVRTLAIPFLAFKVISSNNLLAIHLRLFAADSLQKLISLVALFLWKILCKNASLEWMITVFSLSSLPNTLIIGLPMTTAMYGQESVSFMIQTLIFQNAIWINVLIVLFEYRAARIFVEAERLNLSVAKGRRPGGECGLVDMSGLKQIFPEKTEVNVVSVDRDGEIVSEGNCNGGSPPKEIRPADGGGGSGHVGLILEPEKEVDLPSEDTSSSTERSGMTKLIAFRLGKKITRDPITYSSLIGIIWSLISFKEGIKMPTVLQRCVLMFADTGQALAMFSLGIFMAAQPTIIDCSMSEVAIAMLVRFLISPMLSAATSKLVGLRGIVLHTAIIQAAFPQGVVSFVFAKQYNVYPNVMSTSVVVGMLIAFPIILCYYLLLGVVFK
ncbi:auxin efflux carrier component 2-like [Cucurbita moschata]|uniref:Auxin efflux carrier component n=1 Tax=Cucurbita moschata TaxID=3662 RepID=A0A6J1EV74_CUCMO|nr:auxin efflux carrier component 2-like [Cucurbita moschata]